MHKNNPRLFAECTFYPSIREVIQEQVCFCDAVVTWLYQRGHIRFGSVEMHAVPEASFYLMNDSSSLF